MSLAREFRTPNSKKLNQPKNPEAMIDFTDEVAELASRIEQFDYAQLRAVAVSIVDKIEEKEEKLVYYRASEAAIVELIDLFSKTNILKCLKMAPCPPLEQEAILQLANALLSLRAHVQTAEDDYFERNQRCNKVRVELHNNSTWVGYFHYVIEQYLESLPHISKYSYGVCIRNIKRLSESTYRWISVHRPELVGHYATLQPQEVVSNNHNGICSRRLFSADLAQHAGAQKRNRLSSMLDTIQNDEEMPADKLVTNRSSCFKRIKF